MSVVIKQRAGHVKHKTYLSAAVPSPHYVNNYVRMEYYRALLLHFIHLYFESSYPFHLNFGDALIFYSDRFGREVKGALTAVGNLMGDSGLRPEQTSDKEVCRQKLQDLIFELALAFECSYINMGDDPTNCARVRSSLSFPDSTRRDTALIEFQKRFEAVEECRSRCTIDRVFKAAGKYCGQMEAVRQAAQRGPRDDRLTNLSEAVHKAIEDGAKIACFSCEKMGDAIIAVSMPSTHTLHTLDTLHGPICEAISKGCQIHPSLARLTREAPAQ